MSTGSEPGNVVGFADALGIVLEHGKRVKRLAIERVALLAAPGRVLAEDVTADRDQPPFNRSTRDGFAVRAADIGGASRIVGQVRAGMLWEGAAFAAGEAVEIMTGAPLPAGADAVVMIEHVLRSGDAVTVMDGRTLRAGDNVVPRGSEARSGEVVLQAGVSIAAAEVALAAACGCAELSVYARPRVAIVSTGDELVELNAQDLKPQQIRNSNSYALQSMVTASGATGIRLGIARDIREEVWQRVAAGRVADLLVFSGGVSMGEYDLVEEVLAEFGAEFLFTGVRMQPGRPVVFGRLPRLENAPGVGSDCYFFGLPGNPISTQVTFHCFVEPMLRAMCGQEPAGPRFVQATMADSVAAKAGLVRLLPARLTHQLQRPEVRVVGWQGSGDLAANARANCYVVLPEGLGVQAGEVVTVLLR